MCGKVCGSVYHTHTHIHTHVSVPIQLGCNYMHAVVISIHSASKYIHSFRSKPTSGRLRCWVYKAAASLLLLVALLVVAHVLLREMKNFWKAQ